MNKPGHQKDRIGRESSTHSRCAGGDVSIDGRIILRWILRNSVRALRVNWSAEDST
jgi:hypothetical protein